MGIDKLAHSEVDAAPLESRLNQFAFPGAIGSFFEMLKLAAAAAAVVAAEGLDALRRRGPDREKLTAPAFDICQHSLAGKRVGNQYAVPHYGRYAFAAVTEAGDLELLFRHQGNGDRRRR